MTFFQKAIIDGITQPYRSCPYKFGYEKYDAERCRWFVNEDGGGCVGCWSRQMPQERKYKTSVYFYGKDLTAPTAIELRKMSDDFLEPKSNAERHRRLLDELNDTYVRKNRDYGDSFHESFLQDGLLMAKIRLGDKYSRFCSLVKTGSAEVKDESIRDTLMDLANYALMTVMELDSKDGDKDE